ncbi:MAG TPA: hypothetical protein VNT54_12600 [Solirubrobacteraceae bacterium]|nr:hypothetical protein [Solirubrobacteraceae bacterium]
MTFSELSRIAAREGRIPPERRPAASFVVRSAEGRPTRDRETGARAPKPITAQQAAWLRETRPAG